jgi:murein DD-endopeptidase MepM/ murein hydrolase activator NlpD
MIAGACISNVDIKFTNENTLVAIKAIEYKESVVENKLFFDNKLVIQVGDPSNSDSFEKLKEFLGFEDSTPGPISDLPAAIAPSNGSNNFKGGTYGCVRVMDIPSEPDKKNRKRFCIRCNNCEPISEKSNFTKRYHDGIDISLPFGTSVKAIYGGKINFVSNDSDDSGLGSYVTITSVVNGKTFTIIYGHLKSDSFDNSLNGKRIKKGTIFGKTGNTGNISTLENIPIIQQHCHLQVKVNNEKVNPKEYMWDKLKILINNYE